MCSNALLTVFSLGTWMAGRSSGGWQRWGEGPRPMSAGLWAWRPSQTRNEHDLLRVAASGADCAQQGLSSHNRAKMGRRWGHVIGACRVGLCGCEQLYTAPTYAVFRCLSCLASQPVPALTSLLQLFHPSNPMAKGALPALSSYARSYAALVTTCVRCMPLCFSFHRLGACL